MQQLQLLERPQRVTEKSSIAVLKQLIEVSISCITYIRGLLPETNYELKDFSNTTLKVLKKNVCKETDRLLSIIELGVFDALEKHYLKQMTLGIFADPSTPDTFLECYHFYVTYPSDKTETKLKIHNKDGDVLSELNGMENIKQQSLKMMRSLVILVQTLTDLPDHCFITFRLLYYDDITPKTYQPKYFIDYEKEYTFPCSPNVKSSVGNVQTPYHTMGMEVVSTCDELDLSQTQSQQTTMKTTPTTATALPVNMKLEQQNLSKPIKSTTDKIAELLEKTKLTQSMQTSSSSTSPKSKSPSSSTKKQVPSTSPLLKGERTKIETTTPTSLKRARGNTKPSMKQPTLTSKPDGTSLNNIQNMKQPPVSSEPMKTRCVCELQEEDCGMVLCEQCVHWSHVVCWGFYHEKDPRVISRPFFCHVCQSMNQEILPERKLVALFRTAIAVSWNEMRNYWEPEQLSRRIGISLALSRKLIAGMVEKGMAEYTTIEKRKRYRMLKETNAGKQAVKVYFNPDLFPDLPQALLSEHKMQPDLNTFTMVGTQETEILDSNDEQEDEEMRDSIVVSKEAQGYSRMTRKRSLEMKGDRGSLKKSKMSAVVEPIPVA